MTLEMDQKWYLGFKLIDRFQQSDNLDEWRSDKLTFECTFAEEETRMDLNLLTQSQRNI